MCVCVCVVVVVGVVGGLTVCVPARLRAARTAGVGVRGDGKEVEEELFNLVVLEEAVGKAVGSGRGDGHRLGPHTGAAEGEVPRLLWVPARCVA